MRIAIRICRRRKDFKLEKIILFFGEGGNYVERNKKEL